MFVSHGLCGHCNIPLDAVGKICQRSDSLLRRRRKVVNTSSYLRQDARGRLRHSTNTAAENIDVNISRRPILFAATPGFHASAAGTLCHHAQGLTP